MITSSRGLTLLLFMLALGLLGGCGGGTSTATPAVEEQGEEEQGGPASPSGPPAGTSSSHVLVKPATIPLLDALVTDLGLTDLGLIPGTTWSRLSVPPGTTAAGLLASLEQDVRVLAAELDIGVSGPEGGGQTLPAGGILLSTDLDQQPELLRIGLADAHTRTTGAGARIAVLDTGIALAHPFFSGRVIAGGYDFIDNDPEPDDTANGFDDDNDGHIDEGHGHGTFVASLALTIARDATVLPVRVLGDDLFGSASGVAAGIFHALQAGVDVIHLSVVLPRESQMLRDAIQHARDQGVVVIACAGNSGEADVEDDPSPGGAFVVSGVNEQDVRAPFASFGPGVDLCAPAVDIHGAWPQGNPDTAIWSGTSFAAPMVSGAYLLLVQLAPQDPPEHRLDMIRVTSVPLEGVPGNPPGQMGAGRLDLAALTAP